MAFNIFEKIAKMEEKIGSLQFQIDRLAKTSVLKQEVFKGHLTRLSQGIPLSRDMILFELPYQDLTPQKAFEIYSNPQMDFTILDVSKKGYMPPSELECRIHIPLEQLPGALKNIPKQGLLLVVSEMGLRSIHACEFLAKKHFFNINNVSGGHKFWPGHQAILRKAG